ncbi:MAG: hypothetical protein ACREOI_04500 [bacterium]
MVEQFACKNDQPEANINDAPFRLAVQPVDSSLYQNPGDDELVYLLEPILREGELGFSVDLIFRGDSSGSTTLVLPNRYSGHPDYDGIKNLRVISPANMLSDTDEPHRKKFAHPPRQVVHVQYQVAQLREGKISLGNHYQAILRENYFHFLGETFWVAPEWDDEKKIRIKLQWKNLPSAWTLANSFGVGEKSQAVRAALWEFRHSIWIGGDFRIHERRVMSHPVYVALRGKWNFSDEKFAETVAKIIQSERDFWQDYDFPYYLVTAIPMAGDDDQGGTGRVNAFAMFLSDDRELDYRFKRLLAHEAFHTWNGEKIRPRDPEVLAYWFSEGFSDYYARLLLLRTGLLTLEEYLQEYNKVLKRYFSSSARFAKNARLLEASWSNELRQMPYHRGDILAHNLNAQIRLASADSSSLDDAMHQILEAAVQRGEVISDSSLYARFESYAGENNITELRRSIDDGAPLHLTPNALGPCATLKMTTRKKYFLFGEKFEIPQYELKQPADSACVAWFDGQSKK